MPFGPVYAGGNGAVICRGCLGAKSRSRAGFRISSFIPPPSSLFPPDVLLPTVRQPWYRILYVQVLIGVALGIAIGSIFPTQGRALQPLGDGFIKLVKMIIAPIIFCSVTHGIAAMGDLKKLGRVGGKALLYFEIVSTVALVIGLLVVNTLQPGAGFHQGAPDPKAIEKAHEYAQQAHSLNPVTFLLNIIPKSFFNALAEGDLLQVLLIAILSAFAIAALGERGRSILHAIDTAAQVFFGIMRIVVRLAPLGAMGAMAYTVGSYGLGALRNLLELMLGFYLTAGVFVVVVLGLIARAVGFSIFRFIAYIKEELWLVLGTSSSETALPGMLRKMRALGCEESTVGLVIPTGYSFNLDGTNIYMTMATVFLAQATNTPLDLRQPVDPAGRGHAVVERSERGDRSGVHHPRGHAFGGAGDSDRIAGHSRRDRPVYERVPGLDQSGGQWRGHGGHQPLGEGGHAGAIAGEHASRGNSQIGLAVAPVSAPALFKRVSPPFSELRQ